MNRYLLRALLVAVALCANAAAGTPPQYTAIDLGSIDLPGAGLSLQSPGVLYLNQSVDSWPSLGATPSGNWLTAIFSISSMAVGSSNLPSGGTHAVAWSWTPGVPGMTIKDLGTLPGALLDRNGRVWSVANSYTSNGMIVGTSNSAFAYALDAKIAATHAFLYAGKMIDLSTLQGVHYTSAAFAVNDSLEIVGTSQIIAPDGALADRAFIYVKGVMYDANSVLVNTIPAPLMEAVAIDCQGNVAATALPPPGGTMHQYLLMRQGSPRQCPN